MCFIASSSPLRPWRGTPVALSKERLNSPGNSSKVSALVKIFRTGQLIHSVYYFDARSLRATSTAHARKEPP
jgi:hypothetical protein